MIDLSKGKFLLYYDYNSQNHTLKDNQTDALQ